MKSATFWNVIMLSRTLAQYSILHNSLLPSWPAGWLLAYTRTPLSTEALPDGGHAADYLGFSSWTGWKPEAVQLRVSEWRTDRWVSGFQTSIWHVFLNSLTSALTSPSAVIVKYTVSDIYLLSSGLTLGIWCLKLHQEQSNITKYIGLTVGESQLHFIVILGFIYYIPIGPLFYYTAFYCDLTLTWPQDHLKLRLSKTGTVYTHKTHLPLVADRGYLFRFGLYAFYYMWVYVPLNVAFCWNKDTSSTATWISLWLHISICCGLLLYY